MSTYHFIECQRGHYAVRELCWVLGVDPSAYYAWWQQRQRPAPAWERAVCRAFAQHARRYGTRRLRTEFQAAGYQVDRQRIWCVLRQYRLRAQPPRSLVHSDQGSQYTATRFKDLVAQHGALQSMSRRGNCYDNAQAKSFCSRLKTELPDGDSFAGLEDTRLEVAHYIAYCNAGCYN